MELTGLLFKNRISLKDEKGLCYVALTVLTLSTPSLDSRSQTQVWWNGSHELSHPAKNMKF